MKHLVMHTLAAASLAAVVGQASANASSSATFGNLVITLTDLNPTDGIDPSLSFVSQGRANLLSAVNGWGDVADGHVTIKTALEPQGPVSAETHTDWSWSTASAMAANNAGGFSALSAQGAADSGLDGYGYYRSISNGAVPLTEFTLSANTKVTFSVTANMQSMTSMGYNLDADQGEFAYAHALLNVLGSVNGNFQADVQEHVLDSTYYVRDDNTIMGVSDSWSGQLAVSFINFGATDTTAQLQAFVVAEGQSATWDGVTPVPEPETWAMMLGGLALVGVMGRRRQGRGQG